MAQNLFRFTLSGPLGTKVISEPEGWNKIKMSLERDKEYHSLIELIETPFLFYGSNGVHDGGKDYLKSTNNTYGVNAQVTITIEISTDEGLSWDDLFLGLIDMQSLKDIDSRKIEVVITRDDLWSKFKSRVDTPVIINQSNNLDGGSSSTGDIISINLPSQKIRKLYEGYLSHNYEYGRFDPMDDDGVKFVIEYDVQDLKEIEQMYNYQLVPAAFVDATQEIPFNKFLIIEDGEYTVDFGTTLSQLTLGTDYLGQPTVSFRDTQGGPDGSGNFDGIDYTTFAVFIKIGTGDPIEIAPTRRTIPYQTITGNTVYPGPAQDTRTISGTVGSSTTVYLASVSDYTFTQIFTLKKNDTITIYGQKIGNDASNGIVIFGRNGNDYRDGIAQRFESVYQWDPTSTLFPTQTPDGDTTISGIQFIISTDGVLQGNSVKKDWIIQALVDTPGQTVSNWVITPIGNWENLFDGLGDTYLNISADTVTDPTQAEAFFLHDVADKILDRILDNPLPLYSEYLGSQYTIGSYADDGCGWPYVLVRGLQVRQYSLADKPFSISFNQWWKGVNPIHNLGLTYEDNGLPYIRIEEKAFFYDDNPILYFDWVNNITESYDKDYIFNKIRTGYSKWQSEDISGIDDPQTKHTYATVFKYVGQELVLESDFIAASLAIETTRRTTKEKSKDYKFDNETFIIAIDPAVPGGQVNPSTDDYFDSVTNLLNSDTRYNIALSPGRNLLRWLNYISGCLQKDLTSSIMFQGGEGNYDMESDWNSFVYGNCFNITDTNFGEDQDIDLATYYPLTGHLFQPVLLEFKHPMSYQNYKTIRDNRTRAIALSGTDSGHDVCFIKKLEYDLINSLGTFTVWKK